jgi:hypothetical protein
MLKGYNKQIKGASLSAFTDIKAAKQPRTLCALTVSVFCEV